MKRYNLEYKTSFQKDLKRYRKDKFTLQRLQKVLNILTINPFDPILRTHQVNTPTLGKVWNSRVTGDLRIIWEFSADNELILLLIRLDGHDGVYR